MLRRILALVGMLTVALIPAEALADPSPDPSPDVSGPVVYVVGDSVVQGGYLASRDRLRARLADRLCGALCGTPGQARVVQVACGGMRLVTGFTAYGTSCGSGSSQPSLATMWPYILNADPKPTTIVLHIGLNDAGVSSDAAFTGAYQQLIEQAKAAGVKVIPAGLSPINSDLAKTNGAYAAVWTQRYWFNYWIVATYPTVARWDQVIAVPGGTDLDRWYENCSGCVPGGSGDGIHPNAYGVLRLAEAIPLTEVV